MRSRIFVFFAALSAAAPAFAQNTSTVTGAEVKAGDRTFEYRAAYAFDDDGKAGVFGHRLHFQYALDDAWRGRVVVLQTKPDDGTLKTRSVSLEIQNQFFEAKEHGGWASAVRLDGLIPTEDGRPGRVRGVWINQLDRGPWQFRANLYVGKEIGELAKNGLTLETREEATYKMSDKVRFGAQLFNGYNTTAHIGGFDEQKHQIGPVLKVNLTDHLKIETGALFGLSRAASDADIRLFAAYSF